MLDKFILNKYKQKIDEKYLKSLFVVCKKLEKEFSIFNLEKFILGIKFEEKLYNESIFKTAKKTIPKKILTEDAAVGLAFCFLFKICPDITEIECYQAEGEGYDYRYRIGDHFYKIEMSGTDTEISKYFTDRIYAKRQKFKDGTYWEDNFEKEEIFIVDFHFDRYTYWDSKVHDNIKQGRLN